MHSGLVTSMRIRNVLTEERSPLAVTGAFIFIGFRPNTGVLVDHVEHDAGGCIITDTNMETRFRDSSWRATCAHSSRVR